MVETHPENRRFDTRVRTYGQTLDAQLDQLRGAGCTRIFREKRVRSAERKAKLIASSFDGDGEFRRVIDPPYKIGTAAAR